MKKVYCIIVTYNGMRWIDRCLASISEDELDVSILVVDNASTDNTVNFIQTNFPEVRIFPQRRNLGFGAANNFGYEIAKAENADYIYLLNQDTVSYRSNISKLIDVVDRLDEKVGIISPFHLNEGGNKLDKQFERYVFCQPGTDINSDFVLGHKKEVYNVGFINAAAWLIKMTTINEVGGLFSSVFFHYGEDNNFVNRLHYFGFKNYVASNLYIHHCRDDRKGTKSSAFKNKQLLIASNVRLHNINIKYTVALREIVQDLLKQTLKGNFILSARLLIFLFRYAPKAKRIRKSYSSGSII